MKNEEYTNVPYQHVKVKVLDRLHNLMHKTEIKSSNARHTYKLYFNWRVGHTRQCNVNNIVYVENPSAQKRRQVLTSAEEDPSVKLQPEKPGPYRVVRITPYTVTIGINRLHNIVVID